MPDVSSQPRLVGAVIALKSLDRAKSRMSLTARQRRQLAWAMVLDTAAALVPVVETVVVVGDQLPHIANTQMVADPGRDLNAAFVAGARVLLEQQVTDVLACVADLPTLRSYSATAVLAARPEQHRLYLTDSAGTGTTMLLARSLASADQLAPKFEGQSARRHCESGAIDPAPNDWVDARLDIDTLSDLRAAVDLGLGQHTAALAGTLLE